MIKYIPLIFLVLLMSCATTNHPPSVSPKDNLLSNLVDSSAYLREIKPEEIKEIESDPDAFDIKLSNEVISIIENEKSKAKRNLPKAYWKGYAKSLKEYLIDFRVKYPSQAYSNIIDMYSDQLSKATIKQLEILSQDNDFEKTELFHSLVDTTKFIVPQQKHKISYMLRAIDSHKKRINDLDSKFSRKYDGSGLGLTHEQEIAFIKKLSEKALNAINEDDAQSWIASICGSSEKSGLKDWGGAKYFIKHVTSYRIVEINKRKERLSTSIVYEVINNKRAKDDIFRKRRIKFYFDNDYYRQGDSCVGIWY